MEDDGAETVCPPRRVPKAPGPWFPGCHRPLEWDDEPAAAAPAAPAPATAAAAAAAAAALQCAGCGRPGGRFFYCYCYHCYIGTLSGTVDSVVGLWRRRLAAQQK